MVIAVEPDKETAVKLRANLERQGIEVQRYESEAFSENFTTDNTKCSGNEKTGGGIIGEGGRTGKKLAEVYVAEEDFLTMKLPECQYKVFANPPFHLSSKIVHRLIEAENQPESFYLILQKQFALKLLLTDRHYTSQLGKQLVQKYQTKIKYPLKPTDFTPPPAVPTVLFEAKSIAI